ncbi:MAG TPA: NRDE family protein [Planctomycetota bacterium]
MCVLVLYLGVDPSTPLLVGANRDEALDRPSAPPAEVYPGIVAGRDLSAGGTWFGVNKSGLLVAITNRRRPPRSPEARSRGLLALEALRCGTLEEVEALAVRRAAEGPIAGFNLVAVAGSAGLCVHWDGALRPARFGPGRHIVTTDRDLDDPHMDERRPFDRMGDRLPSVEGLMELLRSHEGERPVCKHGERFGTVSSAIYVRGPKEKRLLYAAGPPCRTPFTDLSGVLS